MTKVELQLLTDIDMLHFVRRGQRGGLSFIGHRHAVANNPLVPNYDLSKPLSYIQLLDANNLYGWAMSQPLPKGGFRFLKERELEHLDILNIPDDNQKGYLVEVSLRYPKKFMTYTTASLLHLKRNALLTINCLPMLRLYGYIFILVNLGKL